jgi:hypothetical protein
VGRQLFGLYRYCDAAFAATVSGAESTPLDSSLAIVASKGKKVAADRSCRYVTKEI